MLKGSLLVLTAILVLSCTSSYAVVLFSDNFDSGQPSTAWTSVVRTVAVTTDNPYGGTGYSARGVYNNIEDSNCLTINPNCDDYYLRYYIYYQADMEYWRCKVTRMGYWSDTGFYYVNVGWTTDGVNETGIHFTACSSAYSGTKDFFYDFPGTNNHARGKWLCLEFHYKLNTPGLSDGLLEGWADGQQIFSQGGLNIRGTITQKPQYHWILGNYSNGVPGTPIPGAPYYAWVDEVVFATERIYPLTNPPPVPATSTPTNTPISAASSTPTPTSPVVFTPTPTPTGPAVIFYEGFESGNTSAWTEAVDAVVVSDPAKVHSGNYAVEFTYQIGSPTNGWLWKKYLNSARSDPVYVRWYQKWETGWVWSPGDFDQKIMLLYGLDPPSEWGGEADWRIYVHQFNGVGIAQLLSFRTPDRWTVLKQNLGIPYEFRTNEWECIEVMIKTNTIGRTDGAVAVWFNGQLHAYFGNIEVRTTNIPFNAFMINCWYTNGATRLQHCWVDDVIVSTQPIGTGNPLYLNIALGQ